MDCVKQKYFIPNFLVRKFSVNRQFSQIFGCLAQTSVETVPEHSRKLSHQEIWRTFLHLDSDGKLAYHTLCRKICIMPQQFSYEMTTNC